MAHNPEEKGCFYAFLIADIENEMAESAKRSAEATKSFKATLEEMRSSYAEIRKDQEENNARFARELGLTTEEFLQRNTVAANNGGFYYTQGPPPPPKSSN